MASLGILSAGIAHETSNPLIFTAKDPEKGTVIGLSITYKNFKDHQGAIEYKLKVGKGTEVPILFPLNEI